MLGALKRTLRGKRERPAFRLPLPEKERHQARANPEQARA